MTPAEIVTAFMQAIERKDIDGAVSLAAAGISYEQLCQRIVNLGLRRGRKRKR